ncbi:retropepsin-like aspartic protease [Pseudofulvibacter geojedonensis]|uniref:Retropepsin-like aspartic protease n=2 Tax=Pseudofulvibacter geojedonensis TaxID=1123758 RepID=A0ABW3I6H0_9FLAO
MKLTKTNHYKTSACINGVKGSFIVDTGASNTCIDKNLIEKFNLTPENSETKAAGAGAIDMETQLAKNNNIVLSKWKSKNNNIIIFDLSHVNQALTNHNSKPVHGIIGADLLKKGKAIIDYKKNNIYLK